MCGIISSVFCARLAQLAVHLICNERVAGSTPVPGSIFFYLEISKMIETVSSENAPKALGPYSQALKVGGFVFCSGQIPINPATNSIEALTIEDQTRQVITNLKNVLEAAGSSLSNVVKTTVFIKDMNDFGALNGVYAEMFGETRPARSCVEVARLPKDVKVEIECIAAL